MKYIFTSLLLSIIILSSCTGKVLDPEYRDIKSVRLVQLGPIQSTAGVDLLFYNPNNFNFQLESGQGDVYIDNTFFGHFTIDEKVQAKKNSEFVIPALLKIDMINAIKQKDILKKKEAILKIEGNVMAKKTGFRKEIPIKYESLQNIEKLKSFAPGF